MSQFTFNITVWMCLTYVKGYQLVLVRCTRNKVITLLIFFSNSKTHMVKNNGGHILLNIVSFCQNKSSKIISA